MSFDKFICSLNTQQNQDIKCSLCPFLVISYPTLKSLAPATISLLFVTMDEIYFKNVIFMESHSTLLYLALLYLALFAHYDVCSVV